MEDVNAWECGRPRNIERPAGPSDTEDSFGLDGDPFTQSLSVYEHTNFGIQSAFHVQGWNSDSDDVRP